MRSIPQDAPILSYVSAGTDSFRGEFVNAIARIPISDSGPTLTLVIAATVCEYGALSTIPQTDLLQSLTARLEDAPREAFFSLIDITDEEISGRNSCNPRSTSSHNVTRQSSLRVSLSRCH